MTPPEAATKEERAERALAARLVQAPAVADVAPAKIDAWLNEIASSEAGRALAALLADHRKLDELIRGIAAYSPYLWDLAQAEPERLLRVLHAEPEAHLARIMSETMDAVRVAQDESEVMRLLRRMKAEAALLIALADIGGIWPVMRVTRALTEVADLAVASAVRFLLAEAARRNKLHPLDAHRPEEGSGYIVLAMGKMGGFELNYSSDIDLIVFFDPQAPALDPDADAASLAIRMTRSLVKILQERTADGYVFRVDLRLRPDPASTHAAVSIPAALEYYERRGQNWERSAMIKARPCAGDIAAGHKLLTELSPFVWRKYMDFIAVADIHAMKRQIHTYKGHGEIAVAGHNVKLGRGGIREIEFFAQTQQLIAGGRHPNLRESATLPALKMLAQGGWISADTADTLEAAYLFLRAVEHRLQMIADEQTHTLPSDPEELERFARFLGYPDLAAFSEVFLSHLRKVQTHYSQLFEAAPASVQDFPLRFPSDEDDRETLAALAEMGFAKPLETSAMVRGWLSGQYASLKSEFAREQLTEFLPLLFQQLARNDAREAALAAFDRFLVGLHGGRAGRFFSMLRQNPDLLGLILLVLGMAPRLADVLAHFPQVMDALIDPTFFGTPADAEKLTAQLTRSLAQGASYEDLLDRLRIFGQEQMFLNGVRVLSGSLSAEQAGEAFASLAEVAIKTLHHATEERFAQTHGKVAGQKTALLALGKLGGREMTATSDLDLILIYDFDEAHPESDGQRPLYGSQYFARLTQRLIGGLTVRTNYGALYAVDMRLRPSGRSGPVATQIDSFRDYQANEAWTWEHMALTRARVISATPGFGEEVEKVIAEILCRPRDAHAIAGDAFEMRQAIAQERPETDLWDLKYAAGGLVDVEFIAQYLQLVHAAPHPDILNPSTARVLDNAARLKLLALEDAEVLRPAVRLYHNLSQVLRLCLPESFDPATANAGLLRLLARAADLPDFKMLEAHLADTQTKVRQSFLRIVGEGSMEEIGRRRA